MSQVSQLTERLAIVSENIAEEAVRQPSLFVDAARYRVDKMRIRARAEMTLEQFTSHLGLTVRAKKAQAGGSERITNDYIKARVVRNPKYRELNQAVQEAEAREEFSKLLLEAYRMRRDALRIVAEAQNAEGLRRVSGIERESQERRLRTEARRLQAHRGYTPEE